MKNQTDLFYVQETNKVDKKYKIFHRLSFLKSCDGKTLTTSGRVCISETMETLVISGDNGDNDLSKYFF